MDEPPVYGHHIQRMTDDTPSPWTRTEFAEIARSLDDLQHLALELGVSNSVDRLSALSRLTADLAEASTRPGGAQAMAEGIGPQELLWSLAEAVELAQTMPWLRSYPPENLAKKLREALKGPLSLGAETTLSNRGRNITFELNLASRLIQKGHRLLPLPNVDLATEIDGQVFVIECKRPFTESRFRKAVLAAYKQLKRGIPRSIQPAWGMIAVSVGRVLNPRRALFLGTQRGRRDAIDGLLDRLAKRHSSLQRVIQDPRVLGVVLHFSAAAYYPGFASPPTAIQRALVLPLHPKDSFEQILLMRLTTALSRDGWFRVS